MIDDFKCVTSVEDIEVLIRVAFLQFGIPAQIGKSPGFVDFPGVLVMKVGEIQAERCDGNRVWIEIDATDLIAKDDTKLPLRKSATLLDHPMPDDATKGFNEKYARATCRIRDPGPLVKQVRSECAGQQEISQ